MKNSMFIFITMIGLISASFANANTEPTIKSDRVSYAEGDHLFTWASYLNLRSEPHRDAKVLAMVPRGSLLTVATDQVEAKEFSTVLIPDYTPAADPYTSHKGEKLKGRWVKVEYEGFTGFVFDGYLSKLLPAKRNSKKSPGEIFRKYLIENYRGAVLPASEEGEFYEERVITPNGKLTYTNFHSYECEVFELNMEDVALQEALMIMCKLFQVDGVDSREDGKYYLINKDDHQCHLIVEATATGASISVWWCEGC